MLAPTETSAASPRTRPKVARSVVQAKHLQQLIFEAANRPNIKPGELSGLSRAFVELEECKRKLRMKPLPKAVDVVYRPKNRKSSTNDTGATE